MQPTQLGPYLIRSRLGRGGMGEVYEAVDTATGGTVAVKILRSHLVDDAGVRQRFLSEIDALKSLRHPGIVRMLAFGEQDDEPYFAMEFVRGQSLDQVLRGGRRFGWRETVAVAGEVARALKSAHDHGIVHRDLKPANLLVLETAAAAPGAADRVTVKLADFGIAKLFGGVAHTALGHVVGTVEYMAPEQASGRPVDHRADLYALGLVMYAMMTGGSPFRGTQLTEIIEKQKNFVPPRLKSLVPDVPPELDELVARLLSKDPAQRPASALALGRLLAAVETLHPVGNSTVQPPRGPTAAAPSGRAATDGVPRPTSHERSNKPTRPVHPRAAPDGSPAGRAVAPRPAAPPASANDPLAATQDLPQPILPARPARRPTPATARGTAATGNVPGQPTAALTSPPSVASRLPTDVAAAKTLVDQAPGNRFTTVEELERTEAARARSEKLRHLFWSGLSSAVVLAGIAWLGWRLLRQPTADELHASIMAVANDEHGDLRDVREAMDRFLAAHADDPRAGRIRELSRTLELDLLERRARRRQRSDKDVAPVERDYRAAMAEEENGPSACVKALEAFLAVYDKPPAPAPDEKQGLWLDLARRQVQRLRPRAADEQADDAKRIAELLAEAKSFADRAGIANDDAARRQFTALRRAKLENVVQVYGERPHAAEAVTFARRALTELDQAAATPPPAPPSDSPTPEP